MLRYTRRTLAAFLGAAAGSSLLRTEAAEATAPGDSADMDGLRVPAQMIPVPGTVSPQARSFLEAAAKRINARQSDSANQQAHRDTNADAAAALAMLAPMARNFKGASETINLPEGAKLYRATPDGLTGRSKQVAYLDIHGGGFVAGGG